MISTKSEDLVLIMSHQDAKDSVFHSTVPSINERPRFPCIVLNDDFFFSSHGYDPAIYNSWYRVNGWFAPINILMPITWISWLIAQTVYFTILTRLHEPTVASIVVVVVGICVALQFGFTVYTMSIDTRDINVVNENMKRNLDYIKVTGVPVIDPDTLYCNICQVHVNHQTKHCKACNKCIGVYDHHCNFLSCCIGTRNYWSFICSITLGSVVGLYYSCLSFYSFVIFYFDKPFFNNNLLRNPNATTFEASICLVGLFLYGLVYLIISGGLLQLTIYHYRLMYVGLTTIGYLDSRAAHGPNLWNIKTKEFRKKQAAAEKLRYAEVAHNRKLSANRELTESTMSPGHDILETQQLTSTGSVV
ncbi:DHHC palmitoyltransferase-domain-containing protein [Globomyces pollinis-pini]|nr:DHHC palmitoyltransferase-domain-containing protein [Globomyces pollinis-pini]